MPANDGDPLSLWEIIENAIDIFATFDDRITVSPNPQPGHWRLTFGSGTESVALSLFASLDATGLADVGLTWQAGQAQHRRQLYHGPLDKTILYQQVGIGLAAWYGEWVRHELHE